jgi:hypothetical protein
MDDEIKFVSITSGWGILLALDDKGYLYVMRRIPEGDFPKDDVYKFKKVKIQITQ